MTPASTIAPSEERDRVHVRAMPPELRVARVILVVQAVLSVPAGLAMIAALRGSSAMLPHEALLPLGSWLTLSGVAAALLAWRLHRLSRIERLIATGVEVGCIAIGAVFAQGVGLGTILFIGVLYELWVPRTVRAAYAKASSAAP